METWTFQVGFSYFSCFRTEKTRVFRVSEGFEVDSHACRLLQSEDEEPAGGDGSEMLQG